MSRIQPFSITSEELSRSLTVAPSQRKGCVLFTIHSTAQPAATIGATLSAGAVEKLVKRLTTHLTHLKADSVSPVHEVGSPG